MINYLELHAQIVYTECTTITGGWTMLKMRRSSVDRRSGNDRRRVYNLDYLSSGGIERRSWKERRSHAERRKDWLRVEEWSSVLLQQSEERNQ